MVVVAQLVRALVCGTRGRGFEPHLPPKEKLTQIQKARSKGNFAAGIFLPLSQARLSSGRQKDTHNRSPVAGFPQTKLAFL